MDNPIASRKRRIAALLIDFWFYGYLTSLLVYFVFFVLKTPWDAPFIQDGMSLKSLIGLMGFIIFANKDGIKGLGLGKLVMGIRVFKDSGEPASPATTFIRNLTLIAWPIETIAMIANSNKRRLGDYLASTQVKRDTAISSSHRGLAALLIICVYMFTPSLPSIDFSEQGFNDLSKYVVEHSQVFKIAEQAIMEEPGITQLIGPIESVDVGSTSNLFIQNDDGEASFVLLVTGQNSKLPVAVNLKRVDGEWQIIEMHYEQIYDLPVL
jgi:uncharacterized RDD family membrane protein YckC